MLDKILNILNKEKTMDNIKEDQATEAMVESIIEEVKEDIKKEKHVDCECQECINRIKQNAK